jgi:hypothetical protein
MSLGELERKIITKEWIDQYRQEHKSRARETRLHGGLIKPRHRHWNSPFCTICDEELDEGDDCFLLYVGGRAVAYHAQCIIENQKTKKVCNIISQDRGFRKKIKVNPEKVLEVSEPFRAEEEKFGPKFNASDAY